MNSEVGIRLRTERIKKASRKRLKGRQNVSVV